MIEIKNPLTYAIAEVVDDNVLITWSWQEPVSKWIKHCVNDNITHQCGWGEDEGNDMTGAMRFTPADLETLGILSGFEITKIAIGVGTHMAQVNTMEIKIWEGGTSVQNAGTLGYQQAVTNFTSFTENAMNEVALTTPFIIDATKELRIGYRVVNTAGYPQGADNGPFVSGKGDLFSCPDISGGTWVELNSLLQGWNYNFSIKAWVTNEGKNITTIGSTKGFEGFTISRLIEEAPQEEWVLLSDDVSELEFTDTDWSTLTAGMYQWSIQAKYGSGLSKDILTNALEKIIPVEYTIIVSSSNEDWGTATGGGIFVEGETITVEAEANTGYYFVNWTEAGVEVSKDASFTLEVTADRDLVANFEPDEVPVYTIEVKAVGNGTVEIVGYTETIVDFETGTLVTVKATADYEWSFEKWTDEDGVVVHSLPVYTFTVSKDIVLTAHFTEVGIRENILSSLVLFPNPFKNEINISNPNVVKSVQITNAAGQKVKSVIFDGKSITTGELANGIYFVEIESISGEKAVYKMIKK